MPDTHDQTGAGILIVDREHGSATPFMALLREAGYANLAAVARMGDAFCLPMEGEVDLVLLAPATGGLEGAGMDALLALAGCGDRPPVLVIAADPHDSVRALDAGARDVVCTPFDGALLRARLRNTLEVRLLQCKLKECNRLLEQKVLDRTTELRQSEARFQRFAELSSDWYWEQDASGKLTHYSGPVEEMLGIGHDVTIEALQAAGWNIEQRARLGEKIANREPFLDFIYSRTLENGSLQYMQVSCEPIFDRTSAFAGYRGIGLDVTERMAHS